MYARANVAYDADIRARAADATVDSIRVPTVLSGSASSKGGGAASEVEETLPALVEDPSDDEVQRALDASEAAVRVRDDVSVGNDMPDVDSDLRAFSAIGANIGSLRREAEKPLDSAFADEELDDELVAEAT